MTALRALALGVTLGIGLMAGADVVAPVATPAPACSYQWIE